MKELEEKVKQLELRIERLNVDMHKFSLYAAQNLQLVDDLRYAKKLLDEAGIDSSSIQVRALYRV